MIWLVIVEELGTLRHKNIGEGDYLAFLSVKYSVDPDKFFQALTSTRENHKIMCGSLSIECRGMNKDGRIFLIVDESKRFIAQVRISENFLSERTNPMSKFKNSERIRSFLAKRAAFASKPKGIGDLRVGMRSINLSAKVLKVDKPESINTHFGKQWVIGNALIGDETGTVKLSLWGEQIGSVSVGDTVQIANARLLTFKGEKQLQIRRNGTLRVEHVHPIVS